MTHQDMLIHRIGKAQQQIRAILNSEFTAKGITISPIQTRILSIILKHHPLTMTRLSQLLSTDNAAITRLVDRLEKAGLVTRETCRGDRRTYHICPTEKGSEEIVRAESALQRVNEAVQSVFSQEERERLCELLGRIRPKEPKTPEQAEATFFPMDMVIEGLEDVCAPHMLW
ncbi:MAG: MarR family winged helix-turn-helix transcriptional regulator [Thermodesulfobacteriota bacterium]